MGVGLEEGSGPGTGTGGPCLEELLGLALRRNPKRAHLLVSQVLGKHVPQSPATVYAAGYGLGERVRELLGEEEAASAVVLGYAETATGLGARRGGGAGGGPGRPAPPRPPARGGAPGRGGVGLRPGVGWVWVGAGGGVAGRGAGAGGGDAPAGGAPEEPRGSA
ncbi:phosphoribosyltransferase domain-containing protein, partial [Streptomyces sp. NPDC059411]|uniref:phosphoribosyltransferase domain-containing protein n=1 Tax=Streptomyces sp. NPDC059411 TaxID=3346825 RepID=UPI0036A391FF